MRAALSNAARIAFHAVARDRRLPYSEQSLAALEELVRVELIDRYANFTRRGIEELERQYQEVRLERLRAETERDEWKAKAAKAVEAFENTKTERERKAAVELAARRADEIAKLTRERAKWEKLAVKRAVEMASLQTSIDRLQIAIRSKKKRNMCGCRRAIVVAGDTCPVCQAVAS